MSGEPGDLGDAPQPQTAEAIDAPYDMNDQRSVDQRKVRAKKAEERADAYLVEMMKSTDGRLLIWRWLEACRIFKTSFAGEAPLVMAFHEGHRNVGLPLLAKLHRLCPELYATMQTENGK